MTEIEIAALPRIESGLQAVLAEVRSFRRELDEEKTIRKEHSQHNREDFQRVLALLEADRATTARNFVDQTEDRQRHLNEQDQKIDIIKAAVGGLQTDIARAKGAGWAVVGILGSGFLFVVGTIVAWVQGAIHIKFGP